MITKLFIRIFICFTLTYLSGEFLFAQSEAYESLWESYSYSDDAYEKEKDGYYKVYVRKGYLFAEGAANDDDDFLGEWKYYWPNKKLAGIVNYENGEIHGDWMFYYPNGNIESEGFFEHGLAVGDWIDYYENGSIATQGQFLRGNKHGCWKGYYENGNLSDSLNFNNDMPNGQYVTFFEDGSIMSRQYYKNGKKSGRYETYYQNGNLKLVENYKNGSKNGERKLYFENGDLQHDERYENGVKKGVQKNYYKGNVLESIVNYDYWMLSSEKLKNTDNECVSLREVAKKNRKTLLWYCSFDQIRDSGFEYVLNSVNKTKEVLDIELVVLVCDDDSIKDFYYECDVARLIDDLDWGVKCFYHNKLDSIDQVSLPMLLVADSLGRVITKIYKEKLTTRWINPDELSRKWTPFTVQDGTFMSYYENGQLKIQSERVQGKIKGDAVLYYPNGQLSFKSRMENNMPVGRTIQLSETGDTLVNEYFLNQEEKADKYLQDAKAAYENETYDKALELIELHESFINGASKDALLLKMDIGIKIKNYVLVQKAYDEIWKLELDFDSSFEVEFLQFKIPTEFTDPRDGKQYKMLVFGDHIWMAENLKYYTESGCWCYDNNLKNCETYGCLYNREAAEIACPPGWHLPTREEFDNLLNYAYCFEKDRYATLAKGGDSGFNVSLGGINEIYDMKGYDSDRFFALDSKAYFWYQDHGVNGLHYVFVFNSKKKSIRLEQATSFHGLSVRCVKD
jgi:uncharacterized protein (TIGR02145 family)